MGYDAINIRYTRDKHVAHTLNEMLLYLLNAKPDDPVVGLLAYLDSAAGRNAVSRAPGPAKKKVAHGGAPDAAAGAEEGAAVAAATDSQPPLARDADFVRGAGSACVFASSLGRSSHPHLHMLSGESVGGAAAPAKDGEAACAEGAGPAGLRMLGRTASRSDSVARLELLSSLSGGVPPEAREVAEGEEQAAAAAAPKEEQAQPEDSPDAPADGVIADEANASGTGLRLLEQTAGSAGTRRRLGSLSQLADGAAAVVPLHELRWLADAQPDGRNGHVRMLLQAADER